MKFVFVVALFVVLVAFVAAKGTDFDTRQACQSQGRQCSRNQRCCRNLVCEKRGNRRTCQRGNGGGGNGRCKKVDQRCNNTRDCCNNLRCQRRGNRQTCQRR